MTEVSTESFLSRFNVEARHKSYLLRITKSDFSDLITRIFLCIYVGFLFSFYTHVSLCMQSLFLFHTWYLDEFCLSVSERQDVKSLPCHELSSCKVFQDFIFRLDLFCNPTSGYEFSNLRLLSWFIYSLWFCHVLPKGEIVKDILCNWLILRQNALY